LIVAQPYDVLQHCQNMAAHLILQQSFTPSLQHIMDRFQWLPISTRINFQIATLTYNTLSSDHPAELISPYQPSHSL